MKAVILAVLIGAAMFVPAALLTTCGSSEGPTVTYGPHVFVRDSRLIGRTKPEIIEMLGEPCMSVNDPRFGHVIVYGIINNTTFKCMLGGEYLLIVFGNELSPSVGYYIGGEPKE